MNKVFVSTAIAAVLSFGAVAASAQSASSNSRAQPRHRLRAGAGEAGCVKA